MGYNQRMKYYFFLGTGVVILLAVLAYLQNFGRPIEARRSTLTVRGHVLDIEIADSMQERSVGLSNRDSLPENSGMLFIFENAGRHGFWMKDTRIPLDMVWIKGDEILGVTKDVQPEPGKSILNLTVHYPPAEVDKVLELNAGTAERIGISTGDRIEVSAAPADLIEKE